MATRIVAPTGANPAPARVKIITEAPDLHPVVGVPCAEVGPLMTRLDQAKAALSLLAIHFGGDSGFDEPAKVEGLMGTLQFVQRLLSECWSVVMEISEPADPLYWGTFLSHSLMTLLEEHQGADAYCWSMTEQILFGMVTGARDQVDIALTYLVQAESQGASA